MSDADDTTFCDDRLRVYLTELARIPPLDRAEEITCIEHVRAAAAAFGRRSSGLKILQHWLGSHDRLRIMCASDCAWVALDISVDSGPFVTVYEICRCILGAGRTGGLSQ